MSAEGGAANEDLAALEEILGYRFAERAHLVEALKHSSSRGSTEETNERLEFLGDALLGAVVSIWLFETHPEYQEGRMTRVRAQVVSRRSLAQRAEELDLAEFLIVGRMFPTPKHITRSILSNAFEALIGAIWLDGGMEPVRDFVLRHLGKSLSLACKEPGRRDHKSLLVQWTQQAKEAIPVYEVLSTAGPEHTKTFEMRVVLGERAFAPGWGRSKKEAEQNAAREALRELGAEQEGAGPTSFL